LESEAAIRPLGDIVLLTNTLTTNLEMVGDFLF